MLLQQHGAGSCEEGVLYKSRAIGVAFGCLIAGCSSSDGAEDGAGQAGANLLGSEMIEIRGRPYLRRDLWSDEAFERILQEGRASLDSKTPEVLAAQLRGHSIVNGVYYIELTPNLDKAREVLARPDQSLGTPGQPPREGRVIFGSDDRSVLTNYTTYPNTTIGLLETGCTGTRIGARTVITAAHCIYETQVANAWICKTVPIPTPAARTRDGASGFMVAPASPAGRVSLVTYKPSRTRSSASAIRRRMRLGGTSLAGTTQRSISSVARPVNTGWLGTWIAGDATLTNSTFFIRGYPARAPCPTGTAGTFGPPTPPMPGGPNTDCPGSGVWPGSTWQYNGDSTPPYSGATLWTSSNANVNPGLAQATRTISSDIDVTSGNSGSGLYFLYAASDRRVVGVLSSGDVNVGVNRFNRFTTEVYNFFVTNTDFPDDTL
jgi:V8-like Glu-specific endopeptidase